MTHLLKLTTAALVVLTPMSASADWVLTDANGTMRPALSVPQPPRLIEVEIPSPAPGLRILRPAPVTHSIANHSICPPGSSLYWSINTDPTEPGPPLGANGYVLGCN